MKINSAQAILALGTIIAEQALTENLSMLDETMTKAEKREQLLESLGPEDAFYEPLDQLCVAIDTAAQKVYRSLVRKALK